MEVLYIAMTACLMPTAGMHIVNDYLVSDFAWEWFIFWIPNFLLLLIIGAVMERLESDKVRLVIIWGIFTICYRIVHIILYFSTPSDRQNNFNIGHAVAYWIELVFNLTIVITSIAIITRMDPLMNRIRPIEDIVS